MLSNHNHPMHNQSCNAYYDDRESVFTLSAIALAAKLCIADGKLNRSERESFIHSFNYHGPSARKGLELLNLAINDSEFSISLYTAYILKMFATPVIHESLIKSLVEIAASDGFINDDEYNYLYRVSICLNKSEAYLQYAIRNKYAEINLYEGQNKQKKPDYDILKSRYRSISREIHPDIVSTNNPFLRQVATESFASISAAYKKVLKAV